MSDTTLVPAASPVTAQTRAQRPPASLLWQIGLLVALAILMSSTLAAGLALSHF